MIFIYVLLTIALLMIIYMTGENLNDGAYESAHESYNIRKLYENDHQIFMNSFVPYMVHVAHVPENFIDSWIEMISHANDDQLMGAIRDVSPPFEVSHDNYSDKSTKTARKLANILKKGGAKNIRSYLDIGAIADTQIKIMSDLLKIPYDNCFGINVPDDSKGSITYGQEFGQKIVLYDGTNIPIINSIEQFDLVTILSTLHHIPSPDLEALIENLGKHAAKYILIKENNLDSEFSRIYMDWQHRLFGRRSVIGAYTRFDLTYNKLKKIFSSIGFRVKYRVPMKKFTKSDFILFERI